ncbi:hypothetical protein, partial [Desulforhopalus sp. IMCC35007]|uniref:hypothetical protein n=1 Tax=Desulforhopalus sp. IMCC35007 TaxID=2569543 RepID=UPI00197AC1CE
MLVLARISHQVAIGGQQSKNRVKIVFWTTHILKNEPLKHIFVVLGSIKGQNRAKLSNIRRTCPFIYA